MREDSDMRRSRGVSAPFAASTTARPRCRCSTPVGVEVDDARGPPCIAHVSTRITVDSGRTSQRPVSTAFGIIDASVDDLAFTSHPKPMQYPQCMHGGRPS
jgi:hypothetical protein